MRSGTWLLTSALLMGLGLFPAQASHASVEIRAYQETTSTPQGTLRGTSIRGQWLGTPGWGLGGGWYLRPGVEGAYGRFERATVRQNFWEIGGLGQLNYPGERADLYLQSGLSALRMSGRQGERVIVNEHDTIVHVEVGMRLRDTVRLDVGLRYQRYRDSGFSSRGIVFGLGF